MTCRRCHLHLYLVHQIFQVVAQAGHGLIVAILHQASSTHEFMLARRSLSRSYSNAWVSAAVAIVSCVFCSWVAVSGAILPGEVTSALANPPHSNFPRLPALAADDSIFSSFTFRSARVDMPPKRLLAPNLRTTHRGPCTTAHTELTHMQVSARERKRDCVQGLTQIFSARPLSLVHSHSSASSSCRSTGPSLPSISTSTMSSSCGSTASSPSISTWTMSSRS